LAHRQIKVVEDTDKTRAAMHAFPMHHPDITAAHVTNRLQRVVLLSGVVVLGVSFALSWTRTLVALNAVFLTFYFLTVLFKAVLIRLALESQRELSFEPEELELIPDEELPVYTILVPLYHEAVGLPRLLEGLRNLDYPKDKLDVLLLLEEDDEETRQAARLADLPRYVRGIVVPDMEPKTKPKACNLGLALAHGEYLVIYDAEDRPDPDQLRKAVLGFQRSTSDVVCLQAKLNFYNQRQNLLTRWFTTDYSTWFDLFLPGLDRLGGPIPLGGTSNHFQVDALRKLHGWDPFNVTEDCELGVRLAQNGLKTRILDSTTWEEACSRVDYWIRQRSRWTKGYVQSWLSHQRTPFCGVRKLGVKGALSFHLMVGGTFVSLLVNPIYWTLTALWFICRSRYFAEAISEAEAVAARTGDAISPIIGVLRFLREDMGSIFPYPLVIWGLFCLFAGNFVFLYGAVLATQKRGYFDLVKYCLGMPFYWLLSSIAAWKGFLQLFTRPSFWEKTRHGLDLPDES